MADNYFSDLPDAPRRIDAFQGVYRFLSNFWEQPFTVTVHGKSVVVPTAEHAFQAMKADAQIDALGILNAKTPGQAKRMGRQVEMRPDWDSIRLAAMDTVIEAKFAAGSPLAERLLATGDAFLQEGNTWGDAFWGVTRNHIGARTTSVGENWLGRLLMLRRHRLRMDEDVLPF